MGFRTKIISLFFLGFILLSSTGIYILENNLQQSYTSIEHQEAIEDMDQMANSIEDKLDSLSQLTNDWAFWDQMYDFMLHPNDKFKNNEIGPVGIQIIGVDFITLLDNNNTLFLYQESNEKKTNFNATSLVDHVKWRISPPNQLENQNCGFDQINKSDIVMICWQQILHANKSGEKAGLLIMGKLLDDKMKASILKRHRNTFDLTPLRSPLTNPVFNVTHFYNSDILQFSTTNNDVLTGELLSIVGQPIVQVQLHFSKIISQRGDAVATKVVFVLLIVTFLNGLLLLIGVHTMLIHRLNQMVLTINDIKENKHWEGSVALSKNEDELTKLGLSINQMLSFIRKQIAHLELVAKTDALTQIPNRLAFDHKLALDISIAKRNSANKLGILLINVDFFKQYNDYYGHPAGDLVLKQIANIITHTANRPSDLCARIGGEEFAILFFTSSREGAIHIANKLISNLAKLMIPHAKSSVSNYVTISVGATIVVDSDSVTSLLKRVDEAVYLAKKNGRNRVYFKEAEPIALLA